MIPLITKVIGKMKLGSNKPLWYDTVYANYPPLRFKTKYTSKISKNKLSPLVYSFEYPKGSCLINRSHIKQTPIYEWRPEAPNYRPNDMSFAEDRISNLKGELIISLDEKLADLTLQDRYVGRFVHALIPLL